LGLWGGGGGGVQPPPRNPPSAVPRGVLDTRQRQPLVVDHIIVLRSIELDPQEAVLLEAAPDCLVRMLYVPARTTAGQPHRL
jgi:hypothetical protein